MVLSKLLNKETKYVCEICYNLIDDIQVAACCCLCSYKAHKKCNRKRLGKNYISSESKNKYPLCVNCKDNTLPFQKQQEQEPICQDNNADIKEFFNTINENNLENIIDKNNSETNPINCKYDDYETFNYVNNTKDLSTLHVNIASLAKHKEEFETALNLLNYKFDIIGITETKLLKNSTPNFDITIPGYKCYHTTTEASKGGTMLYISNKFNPRPRSDLEDFLYKSKELESSFVEIINPGKQNFIIGCIYRHPNMDLNEFNDHFLNKLLGNLSVENKKVFLMGDFNANLLNIDINPSISKYFDIFSSYLYIPHIIYPTRIVDSEKRRSKTLIDNIFSNSINYSDGISGNLTFSISDHLAQFLIIPVEYDTKIQNVIKFKRDTRNKDRENLFLDMLDADWNKNTKIENNDPNFSFNQFEIKLNSIIDKYMPLKRLTKNEIKQQYKPWITLRIRNSIKRRDTLHKKYIKAKNKEVKQDYHIKYKELRNHIVTLCRTSKKLYYQKFFAENANNLKNTWKGIKNLINLKKGVTGDPTSILVDDKLINEPGEVANKYNNYFSTIANKLRDKIYKNNNQNFKSYLRNRIDKSFFIFPTCKEEIIEIINELDCMKATGPHSIPTDVFKCIKLIVSESLSYIINTSFNTGIFIENLKISKIIPIFKGKGNILDYHNYRPISLLSNIDKIIEKLMFKRLYCFLSKNKIIYDLQFGFRENHSTTHALIYITEKIRKAIDENCYSCGIFVDLQKAFDTVDHEILLYKLNHYGIRGTENAWFKSYLSNRKQFVTINGVSSEENIIQHGVPQGSVLGPLLFLLYINDLHNAIKHCSTIHFADDTSLIIKNKSLKQMKKYLNFDLKNLSKWLKANMISLNTSKTELLLFRHPNKNLNYNVKAKINGKVIKPSKYVKYLGIYIDSYLNWKFNTNILAAKLSRSLGMLSKIRHYVNIETLKSIYFAIFSSHLSYASIIWAQNPNNQNVKRIMRLQKRAVRIMTFAQHRDNADPLFKQLGILKFIDSVEVQNLLLVSDSLNSRLPKVLNNIYNFIESTLYYKTRNSIRCKLLLPKVNTSVHGLNSIEYKSIKVWNKIIDQFPNQYLHILSKCQLKKRVKEYFFNKY